MLANVIKHFSRSWGHHTSLQIATMTVLTGTFTIIAVATLIHQNLETILTQWGRSAQVSVYLKDDATKTDIAKVKKFLEQSEDLTEVQFVSKTQAAENFKAQMADYVPDLLFDKGAGNPLPASFEISIAEQVQSEHLVNKIKGLVKELSSITGIDEVSYGQGWVENYASLVGVFEVSSWVLIITLLLGSIFVIGNSIRNSISQRRDEIEILELVGATRGWIRTPYIIEGVVTGVLAALGALILCYMLFSWQADLLKETLGFWMIGSTLSFLTLSSAIGLIFVGAFLGGLGSFLCVAKISSGWAAAESTSA